MNKKDCKIVISEIPLTPQQYLEIITGKCYAVNGDNQYIEVEDILSENGFMLWSYPLTEVEHLITNNLRVVLVECVNIVDGEIEKCYRWFEVPINITSKTITEYFEG